EEEIQTITSPLLQEHLYLKYLEVTYHCGLFDLGDRALQKISSPVTREQAYFESVVHYQYRNPARALDFAIKMKPSSLKRRALFLLAKNQKILKDNLLAPKLFQEVFLNKNILDTFLSFYIKIFSPPSKVIEVLESLSR
ncbi:MAG: hypothetical protein D6785_10145, partial [Planctomycetota bacterium]